MELAMQQPISFLTTAGCLATLVAYHTATEKAWSVDIRTECITWGLLALGRWLQRQTIGKQAGLGEAKSAPGSSGSGILKMDMSPWNRMMWALSICIATARIIPLYYDVASALVRPPLFCYSQPERNERLFEFTLAFFFIAIGDSRSLSIFISGVTHDQRAAGTRIERAALLHYEGTKQAPDTTY